MRSQPAPTSISRHIALVGFPGSGKTTVGQLLAAKLGVAFVDTDAEIERTAGTDIPSLFARGEEVFRDLEAEVCARAVRHRAPAVISTGGGAMLRTETTTLYESACDVFVLQVDLPTVLTRLRANTDRPLLRADDQEAADMKTAALFEQRKAHYGSFGTQIDAARPADEVVEAILATLLGG